jgi:Peptidase family M23
MAGALVYELRLGNRTGGEAELKKIDVVDPATGSILLDLDRTEIAKRFSLGGLRGAESANLGVAQFGVLFLHLALDAADPVPRALTHRVTGHFAQPAVDLTMTVGEVAVADRLAVVLGPPLVGTGYLAGDGCCDSIRHVRALLTLDGRLALAQRFAIDWEQADSQNRLVSGDTKVLANYTIFGKSVLAAADGTVVSVRNDLPEQVPGALPPDLPLSEADGNFVVLDIGGAYVLYAHMQPGSVTVTAGAKVRRGELLGRVGNTGNSQAPHLHLHVMDSPSPFSSNGLPYVIEAFTLLATDQAGTADFDEAEATGSALTLTKLTPPQHLRNALPLDLSVVEFAQ